MWYIASVSWGKDSLAMLIRLLEENYPLDEVVFYDTEMEFNAIYNIRDKVIPILAQKGIKYTELHPAQKFLWDMLKRPVSSKQKGQHLGYGWCGGVCRWGTTAKNKRLNDYAEKLNARVYVGIAADEVPRLQKKNKGYKAYPLADWGMSEADCLEYCYSAGYFWEEDGGAGIVRLYSILDRVSCWCCCNKNLRELKNIRQYLPTYWERLRALQSQIDRPMKGYYKDHPRGISELESRFAQEDKIYCQKKGE